MPAEPKAPRAPRRKKAKLDDGGAGLEPAATQLPEDFAAALMAATAVRAPSAGAPLEQQAGAEAQQAAASAGVPSEGAPAQMQGPLDAQQQQQQMAPQDVQQQQAAAAAAGPGAKPKLKIRLGAGAPAKPQQLPREPSREQGGGAAWATLLAPRLTQPVVWGCLVALLAPDTTHPAPLLPCAPSSRSRLCEYRCASRHAGRGVGRGGAGAGAAPRQGHARCAAACPLPALLVLPRCCCWGVWLCGSVSCRCAAILSTAGSRLPPCADADFEIPAGGDDASDEYAPGTWPSLPACLLCCCQWLPASLPLPMCCRTSVAPG